MIHADLCAPHHAQSLVIAQVLEAGGMLRQPKLLNGLLPHGKGLRHIEIIVGLEAVRVLPVFGVQKFGDGRPGQFVFEGGQRRIENGVVGDAAGGPMILVHTVFPVVQHGIDLIFAHQGRQRQFLLFGVVQLAVGRIQHDGFAADLFCKLCRAFHIVLTKVRGSPSGGLTALSRRQVDDHDPVALHGLFGQQHSAGQLCITNVRPHRHDGLSHKISLFPSFH